MRLDVWFLLSPVDCLSAGRLLSADKQQVELDFFFFFRALVDLQCFVDFRCSAK